MIHRYLQFEDHGSSVFIFISILRHEVEKKDTLGFLKVDDNSPFAKPFGEDFEVVCNGQNSIYSGLIYKKRMCRLRILPKRYGDSEAYH